MTGRDAVTVGLDIGTTSVKAVAVTGAGGVVARTRVRHPVIADADRLRHDARRAWQRGPRRALADLGVQPRAVTVTGMVPSMAAVDRRGRPLSPGLLYGDVLGRRADRQGMPDLVGDAPQFLESLAAECPGATGFWPAQTTAAAALGGPPALAEGVAQVFWPLAFEGAWDTEAVAGCGVDLDRLPQIVADHTAIAEVDGMLLDGGAIDVMCERLVSGADGTGDVLVVCGSTLIVIAQAPPGTTFPPSILAFPDETGMLTVTAASNAGGLFLDWVDRTVARARGGVTTTDVPVWTPYIRGERTPWADPSLRAALTGAHLGHDTAALRRAAFEASGFVVRHLLELMDIAPQRVVAVGGGTRSDGWMQALADCTGAPVDVAASPEGAAIGAAFLARMTAGLESEEAAAAQWARTARRVDPDPGWTPAVGERYRRFRALVDASG